MQMVHFQKWLQNLKLVQWKPNVVVVIVVMVVVVDFH